VYRAALGEGQTRLHSWTVPYGWLDFADLYRVVSVMNPRPNATFVDLGCGLGAGSLWICMLHKDSKLVGIDRSPAAVAGARTLAAEAGIADRSRFEIAAAEATGLEDDSVDDALSIDALSYMDAPAVIRELGRILRPGGRFTCIATEWIGTGDPPLATYVRDYRALFEAAHFTIVTHSHDTRERGARDARALLARADALQAEIGKAAAEPILAYARERLANFEGEPRYRDVFFSADKPP
jgi:SAM-dependent methyltransferase